MIEFIKPMSRNVARLRKPGGNLDTSGTMAQTTTMTSMDQPELARPDRSRKLWVLIIVLGWLLGTAWRLWLSRGLTAPTIRSDEDSYLLTARAFITGIGGETTENTLFRRTGYPLLISPAYLLTRDPGEIYRLIQVINAAINALMLPLAYAAGRRVFRWDRRFALAAAVAASTLPAVAFYSGLAMTEAVLAPLVLGWLLACHAMLTRPRSIWIATLAGALAGLAYLMHVRGVVIAALQLLLLIFIAVRGPRRPIALLASAGTLIGLILFNEYAIHLLGDSMYVSGIAPGPSMVDKLASVRGVAKIVMSAAGQFWYLAIAGFGITAIGMLTVPRWLRKGPDRDRATGVVMVLALLATIGIALMSATVLQGIRMRMNYLAYPRYVHVLEPWWLLTGIAALAGARARRRYLVPALAALLTAGIGVLVWWRMTRGPLHGFYTFDSPELSILTNGWSRLRPVLATLVGITLLAIVVAVVYRSASRRRTLLRLTWALVAINLIMVPIAVGFVSVPMMDKTVGRPSLAELGVRPGDTVVVEGTTVWWQRRNTEREVTWSRVRGFNLHSQAPPRDANIVVAFYKPGNEYHWDGTAYGFHLIGESDDEWAVWRRNSPTS